MIHKFIWRKEMLRQEVIDPDFEGIKETLLGEMKAYDLVVKELIKEFGITRDEIK